MWPDVWAWHTEFWVNHNSVSGGAASMGRAARWQTKHKHSAGTRLGPRGLPLQQGHKVGGRAGRYRRLPACPPLQLRLYGPERNFDATVAAKTKAAWEIISLKSSSKLHPVCPMPAGSGDCAGVLIHLKAEDLCCCFQGAWPVMHAHRHTPMHTHVWSGCDVQRCVSSHSSHTVCLYLFLL